MLTTNAYAVTSATGDLVPTTIERRDIGPHDVLIDVKFAGICQTDIHMVRGVWGPSVLPTHTGPRNRRHSRGSRLRSQ